MKQKFYICFVFISNVALQNISILFVKNVPIGWIQENKEFLSFKF